jgi:hypothetical protein
MINDGDKIPKMRVETVRKIEKWEISGSVGVSRKFEIPPKVIIISESPATPNRTKLGNGSHGISTHPKVPKRPLSSFCAR